MIGFSLGYWRRRILFPCVIAVRILINEKFWTPFIIMLKVGKPKV